MLSQFESGSKALCYHFWEKKLLIIVLENNNFRWNPIFLNYKKILALAELFSVESLIEEFMS